VQQRQKQAFSYTKEAGLPSDAVEKILHRSAPDRGLRLREVDFSDFRVARSRIVREFIHMSS
jgi:hypothetical protein